MKIKTFAVLKEHLGEEFEMQSVVNIEQLKQALLHRNPKVAALLPSCRFAVEQAFINNETFFQGIETIYIIPPSSGG